MWITEDAPVEDKLQIILENVLDGKIVNFPESCPICSNDKAHLYFNSRGLDKIGGIWIWCSACKHYFHGSIMPPAWWENYSAVLQDSLTAAPDVLEDITSQIDEHINTLLKQK